METIVTNNQQIKISRLLAEHRSAIVEMLAHMPQFSQEEKDCAVELMDLYLEQREESDYDFVAAVTDTGECCGFICFGDISLTDACYDLYWIVVAPSWQRRGIAGKLLSAVEAILKIESARKIFAETSSQEVYKAAHKFYVKNGFQLAACFPDFYKEGDDKIVFVKDLIN